MGASEIVVTVGADATELEKGLNDVSKEANETGSEGNKEATSFAATLGRAYGTISQIADVVGGVFEKFIEIAQRAQELRNLSVATGISIGELQSYEKVAKNAGMSLSAFAHSIAEFNKKMGEAKIRGSEANAVLTKLGFGLKDITSGALDYNEALYAMADAYQAGTDEATLMHYGLQLFGQSFEELLPLVKQGSGEIRKQYEHTYRSEEKYAQAAARAADAWNGAMNLIEAAMIDIVGMASQFGEDLVDELNNSLAGLWYAIKVAFVDKNSVIRDSAEEVYRQQSSGKTKEERQRYYDYWMNSYNFDEDEKKVFMQRIKELEGEGKGKKLTPLGLTESQGASSIQQMGGGDIASSIAFSPLERIADATEETARNTAPGASITPETTTPPRTELGS
jgi:hypothetical protein